jgi:hypothetical protein
MTRSGATGGMIAGGPPVITAAGIHARRMPLAAVEAGESASAERATAEAVVDSFCERSQDHDTRSPCHRLRLSGYLELTPLTLCVHVPT